MASHHLKTLQVGGYKSLKNVTVPLQPLSVLVGPNGAGKSNLLDVLEFLGDSIRGGLRSAIDRRMGWGQLQFRGEDQGRIRIVIEAQVTQHSSQRALDVYTLTMWYQGTPSGSRLFRRRESFKFKRTAGAGRRITISGGKVEFEDTFDSGAQSKKRRGVSLRPDSLGLGTLPQLADEEGGRGVREIADLFSTFRVFDVDVALARQPSVFGREHKSWVPLESNASNLSRFLMELSLKYPETFDQLQQDACRLIPGLSRLEFEVLSGSQEGVVVVLRERGLSGTTPIGLASYGSVRCLALLALLHDPSPPLLTTVEEFDRGLHPYAFDVLVDRMRASTGTQYLLTTHSPALVNRLEATELVVCERAFDGASVIPASSAGEVRAAELKGSGEYGLGEIWFTGALGGVPE